MMMTIMQSYKASSPLPSTPTTLVTSSLVLLAASIVIAASLLKGKSEVLTYPVKSTWLQRKHQFRVNGAKVIEQGFFEVSLSRIVSAIAR
jgi:hypothetical protein